ncbi:MAG TPA: M14 family metallopeptidase, partial [Nannocystaceae bacterium]|nr:M14 family metallopeptidase [Nannocystaceae bacterium]
RVAELADAIDAESIAIGASVDGEAITAVRVPARARTADAKVVCVANIHGIEWIGGLVALGLLERLGGSDREVDALRERAEVWLVPCLNPDGYRRTWAAGGRGRLVDLRTNARGVDLNRNFPLPPGMRRLALPGAGSQKPGDGTYCGPSALSEPETRALHELCDAQRFHAAIGMHSFMGTMIHARVQTKAAWQSYGALCRAFADAQPHRRYRRLASRFFDAWTGEQEDHLHHGHDCWAMCIETFAFTASLGQHLRAPTRFWRFNPYDPQPWIANDVPGLLAYFGAALDRPRPSKLG